MVKITEEGKEDMKCKHCRQEFIGPIPLGLHGWTRRSHDGTCPTPAEMEQAGWYNYYGQWMTSKPEWIGVEETPESESQQWQLK